MLRQRFLSTDTATGQLSYWFKLYYNQSQANERSLFKELGQKVRFRSFLFYVLLSFHPWICPDAILSGHSPENWEPSI